MSNSTKKERIKEECLKCPHYLLNSINYNASFPIFSLLHMSKRYNLNNCTADEKLAFVNQIMLLSQITWAEIINAPRQGLGCEQIAQNSIKDAIPSIIKPDTRLIAFRFCGKKPMVGFREKNIFHILWIDRDFTLYDHGY